jgi:hypothetical protein
MDGHYIVMLPKAEKDALELAAAVEVLLLVAATFRIEIAWLIKRAKNIVDKRYFSAALSTAPHFTVSGISELEASLCAGTVTSIAASD